MEEVITGEFLPTTDQAVEAAEEGQAGLELWSGEINRMITSHIAWLRTNHMHWQSLQPHLLFELGASQLAAPSLVWMTAQALNQARGQTSAQSVSLQHLLHPLTPLMCHAKLVIWWKTSRTTATFLASDFSNKGKQRERGEGHARILGRMGHSPTRQRSSPPRRLRPRLEAISSASSSNGDRPGAMDQAAQGVDDHGMALCNGDWKRRRGGEHPLHGVLPLLLRTTWFPNKLEGATEKKRTVEIEKVIVSA